MNYIYHIDNYNATDDLLGVVYIPEDSRLSAHFIRVAAADTEQTTRQRIKSMAPVEVWELEASRLDNKPSIRALVGSDETGTESETAQARIDTEEKPPISDLALYVKGDLLMASQGNVDAIAMSKYPAYERETWRDQEVQARAYLNGDVDGWSDLERIATRRGLTMNGLSSRVLEKAAAFRELAFEATAIRQELEDQIDQILVGFSDGSIDEDAARVQLAAVTWPGIQEPT